MMRKTTFLAFLLGGLAALALAGGAIAHDDHGTAAAEKKAPSFTAKGNDGKSHDLAALTSDGPVLFYFIKDLCPVNEPIVKYMSRLAKAYDGKAKVVGVFGSDSSALAKFQERHAVPFLVLFDAEKSIIKSFKIGKSPESVLVSKDGRVLHHWKGVSAGFLKEMGGLMAAEIQAEPVAFDMDGAPSAPRQG